MTRVLAIALLATLALAGCDDPRDCLLTISQRDCYARGSPLAQFPQDDAICREYGLTPGTHDYAICRRKKAEVRALTERQSDYSFLNNPLTPDVRVVPADPYAAGHD